MNEQTMGYTLIQQELITRILNKYSNVEITRLKTTLRECFTNQMNADLKSLFECLNLKYSRSTYATPKPISFTSLLYTISILPNCTCLYNLNPCVFRYMTPKFDIRWFAQNVISQLAKPPMYIEILPIATLPFSQDTLSSILKH